MILALLAAMAALPHPQGYVCYRAETPIRVDGRIEESAWRRAPWTDAFIDIEGDAKPRPRHRTRAKMLWDDQYFYVAAQLEEPHVWGTLTQHDAVIFHDNDFEVFIDPNSDGHEYFEFEMNALNTGWDLFLPKPYKDGGKADNGWEIPGLKTAVHIRGTLNDARNRDRGWTLEIAMPWSAFGDRAHMVLPPKDRDQWRVNFSRVEWQHVVENGKYSRVKGSKEDNWVWSPQGKINMHLPERWGYVQFSTAPRARFVPDVTWDTRMRLQQYYEAQFAFQKANQRWAAAAEIPPDAGMRVEKREGGWQACVAGLCIREDSKIWAEEHK